mmetsp:Transcript_2323/g.6949  ORF Transcript_2323/g.6949 Transcript_2323/m.6949 type:complete len:197 (-) Transcript_2323:653-1243(-)|eukprot:CAMPEP_0198727736 /NCGR_PEP_ID=MMETSP1475-20131203/4878_1 /TAXON_ID= ORGANISM="Unidentified sp., Strain CCMP1999" /NCGR_SAMPLE_ID=MMETSP1475 /ASSEMBLY_ACC=CAM_ASM_001111 /LENGTH=196 /DNA_ID=CAMNT_0044489851 /DNA_START=156 /DNA_END=746 /DNA_ORIENTATION=-
MGYFYYEDDFEPKGPSMFRRLLQFTHFMIKFHAFIMQLAVLFLTCIVVSYMIYKALKNNDKEKQADLLICCVMFNLVYFAEFFLWWLLRYIPLYYELKLCLFIYLLHPKFRGAAKIYHKFVVPQIASVEKQIDENVDKVSAQATPLVDKAASVVQDKLAAAEKEADGKNDNLLAKVSGAIKQADKYLEEPVVKKTQ